MLQQSLISARSNERDYWQRAWEYRELLFFLARRDLVVKYRATVAGMLWLFLRPLARVLIFWFLFSVIAQMPSDGLPYPVLLMGGITLWTFFQAIVAQSGISLSNNQSLITKVNFPRILLPVSTIVPNIIDLLLNLVVLAAIMAFYHQVPSYRLLFLPIPIFMTALVAVGFGFFYATLSVRYWDFRQLGPFILEILVFLTPVYYTSSLISKEKFGEWGPYIFYLNPMAACVDLFRWCVMPAGFAVGQDPYRLLFSFLMGVILLFAGVWYFRRSERTFADML